MDNENGPGRKIPGEDLDESTNDSIPALILLFFKSMTRPYSYDPLRNMYIWFGFAWGLPIPILFFGFHRYIVSTPPFILFKNYPIHWILALHPFFFGIVFGILGSIHQRYLHKLHRQSIRDGLTGLYNHRYFRKELR